jgi:hypothetical protein
MGRQSLEEEMDSGHLADARENREAYERIRKAEAILWDTLIIF